VFKSVFSKYFSVIALVVAVSFLAMMVLQVALTAQSVSGRERELLLENAESIAQHTTITATQSHISPTGQVVYHLNQTLLSPFLNLLSEAIDADIFITDGDGRILLCSAGAGNGYIGSTAPGRLVPRVSDGFFEVGNLGGLYDKGRYIAATPVRVEDQVLGYVFITSPADAMAQTLKENIRAYGLSLLGALLLSMAVVYLMTYRFVQPLRRMAAATRRFAQGDFSARVPVRGKDEVAELADALNHMAVSLSSVEFMRRNFIANVSHELKTPMTTIAGFVDGILDGTIPPDRQKQYLSIVSEEVKRLSRLVRSMLNLTRIDSGELKLSTVRMDLTEAVCGVLVASEPHIEKKKLNISGIEDCGKMEIQGDPDLMGQVLYNLLDNAIKFTNEGGDIDIRLNRTAGRVYVTMRNTGDGIPPDEMPQIFERFYKSDRSRSLDKNGMGLGLYIVKTVISLHHGEISVRSVAGEFTEFSFWVPAAPEQTEIV